MFLSGCGQVEAPYSEESSDQLAACSSDLYRSIASAAAEHLDKGDVPDNWVETTYNFVDPVVATEEELFERTRQMILSAEHELLIETWEWQTDSDPARALIAALKELADLRRAQNARDPIEVKLLINLSATWDQDVIPDIAGELKRAGITGAYLDLKLARYHFGGLDSNHSKTVIADGSRAIVQGANLNHEHDMPGGLFDASYWIEGDAVCGLHRAYSNNWTRGEEWLCGDTVSPYDLLKANPEDPHPECWIDNPRLNAPVQLPEIGIPRDELCKPVMITSRKARRPVLSPHRENPQAAAFLAAVRNAKSIIRIATPNINESKFVGELIDAAKRGVRVEMLLSYKMNDLAESVVGRGGATTSTVNKIYDSLQSQADHCHTMDIRWFSRDSKVPEKGWGDSSHAKYMSVDNQVVIIGSANHDNQSWYNSRELNLVIDDSELTKNYDKQVFGRIYDPGVPADQCKP